MIEDYRILPTGIIQQLRPEAFTYDKSYVKERYDTYGPLCDYISLLRLQYILKHARTKPNTVLDIGYGNGAFLQACHYYGMKCYGSDISGYPLKYGEEINIEQATKRPFDVVTFFDSLEHFSSLDILGQLWCNYICISVPWCHYNYICQKYGVQIGDEYFNTWKHRRPNEHIFHFDSSALILTMHQYGYECIHYGNMEDVIRKPVNPSYVPDLPNILTAIFRKRNK